MGARLKTHKKLQQIIGKMLPAWKSNFSVFSLAGVITNNRHIWAAVSNSNVHLAQILSEELLKNTVTKKKSNNS